MDTGGHSTIEMAGAGDRQVVEVHDEGDGDRQHHKTRDRRRRMAWRQHRKGGIIITTDLYNNNRRKLSLPRYGGLQCPSGYLCPSRVDDEQGEKEATGEEAR
jgi:hypothetical protein